jgi:hypothetical protein
MITDIWVDGQRIDMYSDTKIKYTLQVNDIAEVKDRQASFTNSFNIPKTPQNIQIFQGLGLTSDSSLMPYRKPSCQVKLDGFDLIIKGWLNITDTGDDFKVYIYSGIIDFFKGLENKSLGDIIGESLNHIKDLATVISSFSNETYRYLIADYNGQTHYNESVDPIINIDYLVPSARVQYLWQKIHEFAKKTFSGEIFTSERFTNLWLTYPKSINIGELEPPSLESSSSKTIYLTGHYEGGSKGAFDAMPNTFFRATKSTNYNIKFTIDFAVFPTTPGSGQSFTNTDIHIYYSINQESTPYNQRINTINVFSQTLIAGDNPDSEFQLPVYLNANDELSFFFIISTDQNWVLISAYTLEIAAFVPGSGDFTESLSSMSATDFVKEILNQFGLTPYTDEHSNDIRYKTISERLISAPVLDWSSKYVERKNEGYVHTNYAQKNTFKYQHADQQATNNNGSILISNQNISAEKDVFVSKTYSPELGKTSFYIGSAGSFFSNVYKIYDKDLKDNDGEVEITYKGLDKRFHFVRSEIRETTAKIGSKKYGSSDIVNNIPIATFDRLDWDTLILDNYLDMGRIINDSRIHDIDVYLYATDILLLDLFCLVYFAQEQQYYIINKLSYTAGNQVSSGEFVRVKRELSQTLTYYISITWDDDTKDDRTGNSSEQTVKLVSILPPANTPPTDYVWQVDSGSGFIDAGSGNSPKIINFPSIGSYQIRYKSTANGSVFYSNILNYQKINPNIYITDFEYDINTGTSSYKLHVENQPFVGYANMMAFKQENSRNARVTDNSFGGLLTIPNTTSELVEVFKSTAVNIQVGVYDCTMSASCIPNDLDLTSGVDGSIAYGFTTDYNESLANGQAGVRLILEGNSEPQ